MAADSNIDHIRIQIPDSDNSITNILLLFQIDIFGLFFHWLVVLGHN